MTLRDKEKFISTIWDFAPLDTVLPGKHSLGDIDAILERNERYLVLEFKSPGNRMPLGQSITLTTLVRFGIATLLVVEGDTNEPCRITQYSLIDGKVKETVYEGITMKDLQDLVRKWFAWADARKDTGTYNFVLRLIKTLNKYQKQRLIRDTFDTLTPDEKKTVLAELMARMETN